MKPILFSVILRSGEVDTESTSLSAGEAAIRNCLIIKRTRKEYCRVLDKVEKCHVYFRDIANQIQHAVSTYEERDLTSELVLTSEFRLGMVNSTGGRIDDKLIFA